MKSFQSLDTELMLEAAPPNDPEVEDWIMKNKAKFKSKYGAKWEERLYAVAWQMHNKKEEALTEAEDSSGYGAVLQKSPGPLSVVGYFYETWPHGKRKQLYKVEVSQGEYDAAIRRLKGPGSQKDKDRKLFLAFKPADVKIDEGLDESSESGRIVLDKSWTTEKTRYFITVNGFGQFWPHMETKGTHGGGWYPVIIRDRNPFKTEKAAAKFINDTIARLAVTIGVGNRVKRGSDEGTVLTTAGTRSNRIIAIKWDNGEVEGEVSAADVKKIQEEQVNEIVKYIDQNGVSVIDHAAYQKKVKKMSDEDLLYTIKDAREAIKAMPNNPKAGYYADEISYCGMELTRRKNAGKLTVPVSRLREGLDEAQETSNQEYNLLKKMANRYGFPSILQDLSHIAIDMISDITDLDQIGVTNLKRISTTLQSSADHIRTHF